MTVKLLLPTVKWLFCKMSVLAEPGSNRLVHSPQQGQSTEGVASKQKLLEWLGNDMLHDYLDVVQ